jgi:hypothetical protein
MDQKKDKRHSANSGIKHKDTKALCLGVFVFNAFPRAYRFRFSDSCRISSVVVMIREFAW